MVENFLGAEKTCSQHPDYHTSYCQSPFWVTSVSDHQINGAHLCFSEGDIFSNSGHQVR